MNLLYLNFSSLTHIIYALILLISRIKWEERGNGFTILYEKYMIIRQVTSTCWLIQHKCLCYIPSFRNRDRNHFRRDIGELFVYFWDNLKVLFVISWGTWGVWYLATRVSHLLVGRLGHLRAWLCFSTGYCEHPVSRKLEVAEKGRLSAQVRCDRWITHLEKWEDIEFISSIRASTIDDSSGEILEQES